MSKPIHFDPTASDRLLTKQTRDQIADRLVAARAEVLRDIEIFNGSADVPEEKLPLDAGFIEYPRRLLDDVAGDGLLNRIESVAADLRERVDSVVILGIGGSYMGARALFEALCHPYHNEMGRSDRQNVPRIYFEGNNVDNDCASGLLELLKTRSANEDTNSRWAIVVISKSGGTMETAASFRLFRSALEDAYGADSVEARELVVPITGETGKLRDLSASRGYADERIFPVPDGIGGRFSIFSPVGLLPAAVMGLDVKAILQGAADATDAFFNNDPGNNTVLDFVATGHLFEEDHGMTQRILSTWGARLEAVGLWYDQLLAESIGKEEKGATPLTVVNTRDLHSRGQQHQEGRRDKLITNLYVETSTTPPIAIPSFVDDQDQLNRFAGKTLPDVLRAAFDGTNQAYADVDRPTCDLVMPELSAHTVGQLLQMLMLATVVEGRLIGINPYGQPGVEAYKLNMFANLSK
ncbi:glucose-6-phosphate isomerase [bacterium]|nr:glucose-6-phosphate isomerase [bacterium]